MPNVKTDFVTKARMLGLPASAGAPALVETGGLANSANLSWTANIISIKLMRNCSTLLTLLTL